MCSSDLDGAVFPGRIMLANTCTWTYRGDECGYQGPAKERISTSLTVARNGQLPEGFAWTDGDNNIVPVTAAELLALGDAIDLAIFNKGVEINTRQMQMKAEVRALQTLEDIRAYRIGWTEEAGE